MKALSAIIATIMLLMISVALVGVFYVFSSGIATTSTTSAGEQASQLTKQLSSCMRIDNIYINQVLLTNCGKGVIENKSLVVMMDDVILGANMQTIQEGNSSVVNLTGLWQIPFGTHNLKISNGAAVAQNLVDVQPNKDGLVGSWNFNEGSGNKAYDGSGNGNTGNLKESAVSNPTFSPDGAVDVVEEFPQNTLQKDGVWGRISGRDAWSAFAISESWTWDFGNLKERTLYARWYAQTTQYPPSYCIDTAFKMEASPDGSAWTTIRTFTYTAANTSPVYEDGISGSYRYVRASWASSGACLVYPAEIFVDGVWSESSEPTWVNGKFNKGLRFDGVNDYVNVDNSANKNEFLFGTNDFAVSLWVNMNSLKNYQTMIGSWNTASPNIGAWRIYSDAVGVFGVSVAGAGSEAGTISANAWHHLTFSRSNGIVTKYKNGVSAATFTASTDVNTTRDIRIGSYYVSDLQYFNGTLDEVRIWNRALAPDETVMMKQII